MIANIVNSILKNMHIFLGAWVAIIVANQLFIYNGCFAKYCLLAALPHTSVIAAVITFIYIRANSENTNEE